MVKGKNLNGTIRVMVPQLMAENGMNISDLAKLLDVSWITARRIRDGEAPIKMLHLEILCKRFEVKPGEIFIIYQPEA